ncbi:MAG: hypothetical protein JRE24_05605 [Deltaproteobacteria bacterium]|nr:hypothetical protein [Deltaproteobacteria bacterium]
MVKGSLSQRKSGERRNEVLLAFSTPKTIRQVERDLAIRKLKMKPFVEKGVLKSLNPVARKGRLFVATAKARKLVGLPALKEGIDKDWNLIGWIRASPRQRLVILRAADLAERSSEEIRERASRSNPHLTRISTKAILHQLVERGLVKTRFSGRRRYYWINEKGKSILDDLNRVFGS